jgi:predicted ArsR family transcriptional regulator
MNTHECTEPCSANVTGDAWWSPRPLDEQKRHRAKMKLMRLLFQAGHHGQTRTQVAKALRLSRDGLDQVIGSLLASQEILADENRDNRGRPSTTFRINVAAIT